MLLVSSPPPARVVLGEAVAAAAAFSARGTSARPCIDADVDTVSTTGAGIGVCSSYMGAADDGTVSIPCSDHDTKVGFPTAL